MATATRVLLSVAGLASRPACGQEFGPGNALQALTCFAQDDILEKGDWDEDIFDFGVLCFFFSFRDRAGCSYGGTDSGVCYFRGAGEDYAAVSREHID